MDPRSNPDRHPFIHTPECNEKWRAYLNCLKYSSWISIHLFDSCGDTYQETFLCFRNERREKARKNHKQAAESRKKLLDKLVEDKVRDEVTG